MYLPEHLEQRRRQQYGAECGINVVSQWDHSVCQLHQKNNTIKVPYSMDYNLHNIYYGDYGVYKSEKYSSVEGDFLQGWMSGNNTRWRWETVIKRLCWQPVCLVFSLASALLHLLVCHSCWAKHSLHHTRTFTGISSHNWNNNTSVGCSSSRSHFTIAL